MVTKTHLALGAAIAAGLAVAGGTAPGATAAPAAAPAANECAGNLLQNADFEGGSRKTEGEGTSLSSAVSNGWVPWFVRGNATINREPEFKVEQVRIGGDRMRVRSGVQSMKFFTTWGTHTAGMYQRVNVRSGAVVTFAIHGMAYSGEADGWNSERKTFESDPVQPGNYKMWVGIDPTGAVPACMGCPPPESVVWAEPTTTTDQWVRMAVAAAAQGGTVTVYAKGAPEWAVKHNDSFWEDACLTYGGTPNQPVAAAAAPAAPVATGAQPAATTAGTAVRAATASREPITGKSYVIQRGDTLSGISVRTGVSVTELAKANGIANPSRINTGVTLTIPGR